MPVYISLGLGLLRLLGALRSLCQILKLCCFLPPFSRESMSFRSIARDIRDSFGSLSRRSFDVRLSGHHRGMLHSSFHELDYQHLVIQNSRWANLPPELLFDVIKSLEESESAWPARKHVVACASVCRSWRITCKEVVRNPEFCGKLTFPVSLKQPGHRDGTIQCFIKRDKSNLTYHLFLCLSPG